MSDDMKWVWMEGELSETAYGPFDSREDALADLNEHGDPRLRSTAVLGRCKYADPGFYAAGVVCDLDDLLERMEEYAVDEGEGSPDDQTFELRGTREELREAERELRELLEDWARRRVETVYWSISDVEPAFPEKESIRPEIKSD